MRGRTIRLSVNRRLVIDAMRLSARVPTAAALRRMELGTVAAARMRCAGRPSWVALFVKAFALTADEVPELRRAYISFPWPHLYEYPENAALVMIERIHRGRTSFFRFGSGIRRGSPLFNYLRSFARQRRRRSQR
jgi:hypothetical protein